MRQRFGKRILSLAICLAFTGGLGAQEKILPPAISSAPPPTGFLGAPETVDFSERALIAPSMFGNVLGTRWFIAGGPGLDPNGGAGGGGTTRTLSGLLRESGGLEGSFLRVLPTSLNVLSSDLFFNGISLPLRNYTSKIDLSAAVVAPVNEVVAHTVAIQAGLAGPNEIAVFNLQSRAIRDPASESPIFNVFLVYDFLTQQSFIIVPNPTDGGLAGRNRVSTDSSPLPRDRIIFNYDFVSNANIYPTTPTMNRYVMGFEKTFLGGIASVEFRVPFASTVSSTSNADGSFGSGRGEFGNLFLILKSLIYSNDSLVFSGGLGLSIPTADDVRLNFGGSDALKIKNEAFIMTPYLAALFTPTDRLFAQGWLGFSFDTNGNPVLTDLDGAGLQSKGRLYDPSTVQLDLQLGYWLIHPRDGAGYVRGLAPFVEFHLNHQLQGQNSVNDGTFTIAPGFGQLSELNLSTGFAAQLGSNINLMVGATIPLTNEQQRFSDWQLGFRLNYYFGATGRARINAFN